MRARAHAHIRTDRHTHTRTHAHRYPSVNDHNNENSSSSNNNMTTAAGGGDTSQHLGARLGEIPPSPTTTSRQAPDYNGGSGAMKLVIQLNASNLGGLDSRRHQRHDYFATVEVKDPDGRDGWIGLGKTEVVYNSVSPSWANTFSLEYSFNVAQLLRFRIYRLDGSTTSTRRYEALGEVQSTVATIVLADKQVVKERLRVVHGREPNIEPRFPPCLNIRAEEERGDLGDSITLQFGVTNLRRGLRPFYTLKRENSDKSWSPVQFSEVHRNYDKRKFNTFKPITLSLTKLVNSDLGRKLRIEFSEYSREGQHYRGGHADFTLNSLRIAQESKKVSQFVLIKNKANGSKKECGILKIIRFEITNSFTFLDYIRSGIEINCVFAVDMSSTNGNPRDPKSLQFNSRTTPNEYVVALREVGRVLAQYDTDNKFPAYGFSACLPPQFHYMSYCFALSGSAEQPECNGIEGVIQSYYKSLDHVAPHQPCHLHPVIQHVVQQTSKKDAANFHTSYTVLLLITDGDYHDQKKVADTICAAADLPLSIVIVGIGNSEFPLLDELDGDDIRLCNSEGVPASRDIVQVVHFHKHRHSPAALARETLAEIPSQLISYMRSQGLRPTDIDAIRKQLPPKSPADVFSNTPFNFGGNGAGTASPPIEPPTPDPPSMTDLRINVPDSLEPSESRLSFYSASSDGNNQPQPPPPQPYVAPPPVYHSPLRPPADLPQPTPMQASILTLNLPPGVLAQHAHAQLAGAPAPPQPHHHLLQQHHVQHPHVRPLQQHQQHIPLQQQQQQHQQPYRWQ